MEPQEERKATPMTTWLVLVGVFFVAVIVTVAIGNRSDGTTDTTFPDLGDIANADPNVPATDDIAPGFRLATFDGDTFDLDGHVADDGRPIVLNLWASWCGPCRAEMPAIETASLRHPEVAFVGVAVKDVEDEARAFAAEIGITYPLAFDDGTVDDKYPVLGLPATFFIAGDGTIVKRHFGPVTVDLLDDDIAELFGS